MRVCLKMCLAAIESGSEVFVRLRCAFVRIKSDNSIFRERDFTTTFLKDHCALCKSLRGFTQPTSIHRCRYIPASYIDTVQCSTTVDIWTVEVATWESNIGDT